MMGGVLVELLVCCVLYVCGVSGILLLSHYKLTHRIMILETTSLRLGLLGICAVMCTSAWRFWYVAVGQHRTNWGVGLGTFLMIMAPIAWVYYKRKQDEGRGTWLITKRS